MHYSGYQKILHQQTARARTKARREFAAWLEHAKSGTCPGCAKQLREYMEHKNGVVEVNEAEIRRRLGQDDEVSKLFGRLGLGKDGHGKP